MTDNRNRTAGEIRSVITRHGGNLGASGSVAYMFKKQGLVVFDKTAVDEDKLTEQAIELGARTSEPRVTRWWSSPSPRSSSGSGKR